MKRFKITSLSLMVIFVCLLTVLLCACTLTVVDNQLKFVVDGSEYATIKTKGNEVVKIPENPTKNGYSFDGWYWDKDTWERPFTALSLMDTPISSNMTVYAKFSPIEYSITYNADGGTHTNRTTYTIEDSVSLAAAQKDGYSFVGWFTDSNHTQKVESIDKGSIGDKTLYANYELIDYTITYADTKDVENKNPASYNIETETITLSALDKLGYTFLGWYNGSTPVTEIPKGSFGNLSLTAKWEAIQYSITYHNVDGATNANLSTYDVEEEPLVLLNADKKYYNFLGWFTDSDCTNQITEIAKDTIGNIDLYAKWEAIEYTATFMDGETVVDEVTFTVETDSITEPEVPEHIGYSGVWESYTLKPENITINANYTVIDYSITYHNVENVTNANPSTYNVEDEPLIFVDASKPGYTFLGWYTDSELNNQITEIATNTVGNLDLYAKWEIIEYTATFMDGETVVDEVIFTVESDSITEPEVPEHIGYNGVWESYTLNPQNITINAVYTIINYSITYHNVENATNSNPSTYNVEDEPLVLVNANRDYYNFLGWFTDSDLNNQLSEIATNTVGNIDLYAKWEAIEYTATFMDGDTVVDEVVFTVETDSITEPEIPEHTGYNGVWESYTLKPENLTINACYTIINYSITYHNLDNAINVNPYTYNVEDEPLALVNANKNYYNFLGWFTDSDLTNQITEIVTSTVGDLDLYAKWEAIEYTATFMDGETVVDELIFTVETDSISTPEVPEHIGYNGVWESYTLKPQSFTVNAVYTIINYSITYHNVENATNVNPTTYNVEDEPLALVNANRDYYNFLGWFTDSDCTNQITEIAANTVGNLNLYAKWEAIEYIASFMDGETVVNEVVFTVESDSISEPEVPEHIGYNGMWESYMLKPQSFTVNAVYTIINYSITYHNIENATNANPTTYNVEDEPLALVNANKDYYNFLGWFTDSDCTSQITEIATNTVGDFNLYAKWEAISYSIAYLYDNTLGDFAGGVSPKTDYTVEDSFALVELECKQFGYTFDGWFTEKNIGTGVKVEEIHQGTVGNITLYAHFGLEEYNITYNNVNGATNTNPTYYTVESEAFTIYPLAKEGYIFDGWFVDSECMELAECNIPQGSYGNITLYAKWSEVVYTIEYVSYGGMAEGNPSTYTISGSVKFNDATLESYVFKGWYDLPEGGNLITEISVGSIGNKVLYAHWDYISAITFVTNGGSAVESIVNVEGTSITEPTAPTKNYYSFAGWYSDIELSEEYTFTAQPAEDITLYAKWTPIRYEIEYVLNGGTNNDNNAAEYTVEDKVELYAPSKVGHEFVGWFTDSEFTSVVVTELPVGTNGKITLYAHYSINKYTINFESNGGTTVAAITQNYDTEVLEPETPAKNGYNFVGWYSDVTLNIRYTFSTMPAENITLYAKWQLVNYDIVYNLNGGTNSSRNPMSYTVTSNTITLQAPTKTGYNFLGWFVDSEYSQLITEIVSGSYGNLELFAKWEVMEYTISYITIDGVAHNNPTTYTIETDLTTLENAVLLGYTFDGWYSDDTYTASVTIVAGGEIGDKTLYGKLTANSYDIWLDGNEEATYQVSFDLNGADGVVDTQTITPTNTLRYPTIPERTGYMFAGWYDNSSCSGSPYNFTEVVVKDTILYAKWIATDGVTVLNTNGSAEVNLEGVTEQMLILVPLISGNITITSAGDYDTSATLYNENMTKLIDNDDGAADKKNFQIVYNVTAGKAYYVGARAYSPTTTGKTVVSLSGNTAVADGGYTITTSKSSVTYGQNFSFATPNPREGFKFLGYADINNVMYTDEAGASVRVWDKAEETILYSVWERAVYTTTLKTTSSTVFATVTLPYGERLDLSEYQPTAEKRVFTGWLLDGVEYNASTMPDHNITLMARFANYTVSLKVDVNKKAISVNDAVDGKLPATLFNAVAIENVNGTSVPMEFECIVNGSLTAGETISVMIQNREYQLRKSIDNIKVYGMPTLTITNSSKDYINPDEFNATAWGASGTDTYGEATQIKVHIDGEYTAGNAYTVVITSTDKAGNVIYGYVENVKVYEAPIITYNQEKTAISVNDTIEDSLFTASATDSFGKATNVSVKKYSGTITSGNTVVIRLTATDSKGNLKTVDITCKVYGAPQISNATKTEFTESDSITIESLGLTAKDTYNESLAITFEKKDGEQMGGSIMVYTATVTDVAGNMTTKEFNIKIYGTPTITVGRTDIKVTEDPRCYVVTFNLNGGQGSISSQTVTSEMGIVYPQIPTRSGYIFGGWYTTSDCEGTPYDFTSKITQDITLYAKWVSYSGTGCISYNGSLQMSVVSKSSSTYEYYAFVPLVSGTVLIYSTGSLDTYGYLYDDAKKQLNTNDDDGDGSNFKISYSVTAGRLYYVRPCGYSSSGTTTVYVSGAMPAQGGNADTAGNPLNAVAKDSFGNTLPLQATLQEGELKGGTEPVYLLSTTDKLGNQFSLPVTVRIYDENDIVLDYAEGYSSLIKRVSKGEEFLASATDSFGEACDITIEAAQGYTLEGGNTIDLYVVAIDKAGNKRYSNLISNIKVYDTPRVVPDGDFVQEATNLDFFYKVYDSFGEELFADISVTGEQKVGETISVTVTATDVAGNTVNTTYIYDLLPDTIQYSLNTDKRGYTLIKYTGNDTSVVIPDTINGLPVVAIGTKAFVNCNSLTSVTIPNSVISIGSDAFSGCSGLTSMTLPFVGRSASATSASESTLFGYIFGTSNYSGSTETTQWYSSNGTATYYIPTALHSVTITGGNILYGAFDGCIGLISVTIGNSVTSIGKDAFDRCFRLVEVYNKSELSIVAGSENYGEIGYYAKNVYTTENGSKLTIDENGFIIYDGNTLAGYMGKKTEITIPNTITHINQYALSGCSRLMSITIPDNVTSIGDSAFSGCSSLTSITLPFVGGSASASTSSESTVFGYIFGITSYSGATETYQYTSGNPATYYIPTSLKSATITGGKILYGAFSCCSGLTSITIPDSVTSIGSYAFYNCSSLTSITIPDSVTSIGNDAFDDCYRLVEVYNKSKLDIVAGNKDYGYVGYYAINVYTTEGISKLTTDENGFVIYNGNTLINYIGEESMIAIPNTITIINQYAFKNYHELISIIIPDSVTGIGDGAFSSCYRLVEVYNKSNLNIIAGSRNYGDIGYYAKNVYTTEGASKLTIDENGFVIYDGNTLINYIGNETEITIPNTITIIDEFAFENCHGLTNVTIGNSVTRIGYSAFSGCCGLTSITLPFVGGSASDTTASSSTLFGYIFGTSNYSGATATYQHYAYDKPYETYYIPTSLKSVTITNGNIQFGAFSGCSRLTSIIIPNGVTSIERYAFSGCSGLTSITIPNSVISIGNEAFGYCSGLRSITIGNSVTSIGSEAFQFCHELIGVTIPDRVKNIGIYAFRGCSRLTSVTIGSGVTIIDSNAFEDCYRLIEVYNKSTLSIVAGSYKNGSIGYYAKNVYKTEGGSKLTTDENGFVIYDGNTLVNYIGKETEITIPNIITKINQYAFYNCSGLTSITIPDSVTSIGDYAFYRCSELTNIIISDSLTNIGDYAFYGCSGLTSITIPNSVTSIGESAFSGCSGLTSMTLPFVGSLFGYIFGTSNYSGSTSIKQYYYDYNNDRKEKTFYIPTSLKSLTITGGYILYGAFYNCSGLTSVTIGNGVTSIGKYAFSDCRGLTSVTIGNSVTSIGEYAFYNCSGLTSITIPNSVTSIGSYAFVSCYRLIEVYNKSKLNIVAESKNYDYVGYYAKNVYTTEGGSKLTTDENGFVIYDDNTLVCYIGENTEITIPNTISIINQYAFYNCSGLTSITIPDSVTSIGRFAFYNCSGLTSITIGNGVTSIGDYTFYNCSRLTSITIPDSVTSIGRFAFYECYRLTSITIPDSVTSIGNSAFYECGGLTSVTIGNSVTSIGYQTFYGCSGLTSVTFSNTSAWWYVTKDSSATGGTSVSVTDSSQNATYLTSSSYYRDYYWKRNV